MSFREKSILVSFITTVLVFGYYFVNAFRVLRDDTASETDLIGYFIISIVVIVVIEIVLHTMFAITHQKDYDDAGDERDKLVELKSRGHAYILLSVGVWITAANVLAGGSAVEIANLIVFFFILAEVVRYASQLFYYRVGT